MMSYVYRPIFGGGGGFSYKTIHVVNTTAVLLLLGEYVFISEEQMGAAQQSNSRRPFTRLLEYTFITSALYHRPRALFFHFFHHALSYMYVLNRAGRGKKFRMK